MRDATIRADAARSRLYHVSHERAERLGAACLDGSRPAFWYDAPRAPCTNTSWLLYLDGGGWCYSESECASRANGPLGSSKRSRGGHWPYTGVLDRSTRINPTFASFHRVIFAYCDGASFTGDLAAPLQTSSGPRLRMRGRANIDSIVGELLEMGLADAEAVLWTGASAGGLGALASAERVRAMLPPSVHTFKVLLMSSWFLSDVGAPSACQRTLTPAETMKCRPWHEKMRALATMHNVSLPAACVAAASRADRWRCLLPAASAPQLRAPLFVINSALDAWQGANVWRRSGRCHHSPRGCNASEVAAAAERRNGMLRTFVGEMRASGVLERSGNGAHVVPCAGHVAEVTQSGAFISFSAASRTMRDVLGAWWVSPPSAPAAGHVALPCEELHADSPACESNCRAAQVRGGSYPECRACVA